MLKCSFIRLKIPGLLILLSKLLTVSLTMFYHKSSLVGWIWSKFHRLCFFQSKLCNVDVIELSQSSLTSVSFPIAQVCEDFRSKYSSILAKYLWQKSGWLNMDFLLDLVKYTFHMHTMIAENLLLQTDLLLTKIPKTR